MASTRLLQRSFVGGEVSPELLGHAENPIVQNGCRRLRNFVLKPTGGAQNRPGLENVRLKADSTTRARAVTFRYSADQTVVLELGVGYVRFYHDGAAVLIGDAWSATTAYVAGQQVIVGSVLYRCILGHTNQTPPNATYWDSQAYVADRPFIPADVDIGVGNNWITFAVAHGLTTGDPMIFTSDNAVAIPGPLVIGTTYYAIVLSATRIRVASTAALAIAGTAILLTTVGGGGGQHRMNFAYVLGDIVSFGGSYFTCQQSPVLNGSGSFVPGAAPLYWYALPADGVYQLATPYAEAHLREITYTRSFDVMTFGHRSYGHYQLRRFSGLFWTFSSMQFGPKLAPPTGVAVAVTRGQALTITAIPSGTPLLIDFASEHTLVKEDSFFVFGVLGAIGGTFDGFYLVEAVTSVTRIQVKLVATGVTHTLATPAGYTANSGKVQYASVSGHSSNDYCVTAVDADGFESNESLTVTATNNIAVPGSDNTVSWFGNGASRYRVYKKQTGLFGLIGETTDTSFKDDDIGPDLSETPPQHDGILNTSACGAVGQYDQRLVLGGSVLEPQTLFMTRPGTQTDFSYHIPLLATDRIRYAMASPEAVMVRHIVALPQLLALSSGVEFRVTPRDSDVLTAKTISALPQSQNIGASYATPQVVGNVALFGAAAGGHLYEIGFNSDADSYISGDLSLRSAHLFDGLDILEQAYARAPYSIDWCISSGGDLLGLTYVPSEKIGGWHRHDTGMIGEGDDATFDTFESCTVATENGEDRLYVMTKRTVNGTTKRFMERLGSMAAVDLRDTLLLDCASTLVTTAAVTTIGNLGHLEGRTVGVLANGVVQERRKVKNAQITLKDRLPPGDNKVFVGLPIQADLIPVPATMSIPGLGTGMTKNVNRAWLRVVNTAAGFRIGSGEKRLHKVDATTVASGILDLKTGGLWSEDGDLLIRQDDPLPLNLVALTYELTLGG